MQNIGRTQIKRTLILSLIMHFLLATISQADWLPPQPGDLQASHVLTGLQVQEQRPRELLTASWAVSPNRSLEATPSAFVAKSRSYTTIISGDQLADGFVIETESASPILRFEKLVSPDHLTQNEASDNTPVQASDLLLVFPSGAVVEGSEAFLAIDPSFKPVHKTLVTHIGRSALQLRPDLGLGKITLKAPNVAAGGLYRLHIFERESEVELSLQTDRAHYLRGDVLRVEARLKAPSQLFVDSVSGLVVSPVGDQFSVQFKKQSAGLYVAEVTLDSNLEHQTQPWRVGARVEASRDGLSIRRDAQTSFGFALPSARLDGQVRSLRSPAGGLQVALGLDVGTAGRFEARGLLFGTDASGRLRPIAAAQVADWLEPSAAELELVFGPELFDGTLGAPFELRDLRLIDQGQRGLLHRQARAVLID